MRIISGTAGGITIKVPDGVARPTTDRVREAVFSMIGEIVEGARVVDLYAGSGALGMEALSRGAAEAAFVDQHTGACQAIKDNLAKANLRGGRVLKGDAVATLRRLAESGARADLIFADPPYVKKPGDTDHARLLLENVHLRVLLEPGGVFVLETMVTKHDSGVIAGWDVVRDRAYGSTRILILQNPTSAHAESPRAADLQPAASPGAAGDGARSVEEDAAAGRQGG